MAGLALAACALAAGLWLGQRYLAPEIATPAPPAVRSATVLPSPRPLQPFHLTDHRGRPFTIAELEHQWTFLSFGYTFCPDICPTTLATLNQAVGTVPGARVVFVSVDPERDIQARLAEYIPYFNPAFVGARGTKTDIDALTGQLGVLYQKVENVETALGYLVDHTASVFLVDPKARLAAIFGPPHDAEAMREDFETIRGRYGR